jgi:outer membrane biosynthesis protein TonB
MIKRFVYIALLFTFAISLSFAGTIKNIHRVVTFSAHVSYNTFLTDTSAIRKPKQQQQPQQEDDKKKVKEIAKAKRQAKPEKIEEKPDVKAKPKRERRPEGMERPPEIPRRNGP